jgi:hypothetical protein
VSHTAECVGSQYRSRAGNLCAVSETPMCSKCGQFATALVLLRGRRTITTPVCSKHAEQAEVLECEVVWNPDSPDEFDEFWPKPIGGGRWSRLVYWLGRIMDE